MAEKLGIKETGEAVDFVATLTNNVVDAAGDGKFDWWEAVKFRDSAGKLPAAINGYKQIVPEIADLDELEAEELKAIFAKGLDIPAPGDEEEVLIEEGVGVALQLVSYFNKVRAYRQAQKEQQAV